VFRSFRFSGNDLILENLSIIKHVRIAATHLSPFIPYRNRMIMILIIIIIIIIFFT